MTGWHPVTVFFPREQAAAAAHSLLCAGVPLPSLVFVSILRVFFVASDADRNRSEFFC